MSAYTFKITINDETNKNLKVATSAVYNQVKDAHGDWHKSENEGGKEVWEFISQQQIVGSSGALRIEPASSDGSLVVAFGWWHKNDKFWVGIAPDLPSDESAGDILSQFYGNGQYDKEGTYWSQEFYFTKTGSTYREDISIIVVPDRDAEVLNTTLNIRSNDFWLGYKRMNRVYKYALNLWRENIWLAYCNHYCVWLSLELVHNTLRCRNSVSWLRYLASYFLK